VAVLWPALLVIGVTVAFGRCSETCGIGHWLNAHSLVQEATSERSYSKRCARSRHCEKTRAFKATIDAWLNVQAWNDKGSTFLASFCWSLSLVRGILGSRLVFRSSHLGDGMSVRFLPVGFETDITRAVALASRPAPTALVDRRLLAGFGRPAVK
jgi:hypothetical protein